MPEPDGLTSGTEALDGRTADDLVSLAGAPTEHELTGPDRGLEHSALYSVIFLVLVAGSMLLQQGQPLARSTPAALTVHTVMESIATILAFIVAGLALVRYYSRKQTTFLLIGCGFLGAAILDLNHLVGTAEFILEGKERLSRFQVVLGEAESLFDREAYFGWTWAAGRVYLSIFLFMSLLAWRQEVNSEGGADSFPETSVYLTALVLTVANLLFFDTLQFPTIDPILGVLHRPGELVPALFFALSFVGFYQKGSWRRDQFEHWLLVSLLIAFLTHAAFMMFSRLDFDWLFETAHLLKITSYLAILSGLLSSVYATFTREAVVLDALTESNDALAREIDFRAKSEQAVKESSERLQLFLDDANDLIQSVDEEGRFLYVNRSWKRALGYSDEDLDRMTLFQVVHPEHRGELERELKRVLAGGAPKRFNTEYVASDGRLIILSGSTQAQLFGGRAVATQSILRDVTEQRLAERRLDESQRNLEALVENTGDSIWSVDRDHSLITLNSAFSLAVEARTGQEPKAGMLPSELFPVEDDAQWYREVYAKTLAGERHVAVRSDLVDGHQRYFELYANPIQSAEGVIGAVFFGKDVTQRVRAEEALQVAKDEAEAANKAKSDFLANMSHELRTPLNSVIGFTNILLKNKDERLNEKDIGFLSRVLSNGKHLLALINEVLDLAKVEAGRMELIIEEIDLAHLCVETVQQLEGQAKAKEGNIALLADVPETVDLVETDSAKLKQVIINLVGNALKFTHEGSVTVRLEMARDDRTPIGISVVDTGIGIPEDRLGAIFEAFQQAEAGTSRKYGGTGLGLALSRSICLLMGYDLIVESEVGKGSTFRIVMGQRAERPVRPDQADDDLTASPPPGGVPPVASDRAESKQVREADPWRMGGPPPVAGGDGVASEGAAGVATSSDRPEAADSPVEEPRRLGWSDFKVLVIDDEADSRVLISHILSDFGCQVFVAANGKDGLSLAREHKPDLITLDMIMPELAGPEVLKRLKADSSTRAIPVVVVSMVASEGRGKLLGAVDMITKPFEREDLLRVLWKNLGRRRGGRVLLMVADEQRQSELAAVIGSRGLEVAESKESEFAVALAREAPDAVVLDMAFPGLHGVASLLELREDRVHTGLPVLVVNRPGLNAKEQDIIRELATVSADPPQAGEKLATLLDASFPVPPDEPEDDGS